MNSSGLKWNVFTSKGGAHVRGAEGWVGVCVLRVGGGSGSGGGGGGGGEGGRGGANCAKSLADHFH